MKIKAKCEICGAEYWKSNGKSKYCSAECKKKGRQATSKKWREDHPEYLRDWREKHPDYVDEWNANHKGYNTERSRKLRDSEQRTCNCIICGKQFTTYIKHKWTCSKECAELRHQKRIPNEQIVDADISLKRLFDRDAGICYLCGGLCDWSDRDKSRNAIHKMYPSIDHVIPISKGGLHSWENVRLAHVGCNASKRDR